MSEIFSDGCFISALNNTNINTADKLFLNHICNSVHTLMLLYVRLLSSVFRSAGGVYTLFLCDADQEDLAFLCSPPPSGGQTVPGPTGDHRLHQ